ncbi:uncharacterized protein FOMMEDRAFT_30395 [Fomitiporia mediterranea MF3/22]|uniref:uncharacterized protein n=1 Tax=Fomitiporia mediterranea (strain MF3/22) TaxID=694068 RepID=UPI00044072CF|nr:uncharacterized protein FOMMEDRAFT_30395 [Fomitiporia mediterranea MF3/22]EJD00312.1 hypothetical protein FOMMEDRAFT_30395 [Fomitiporia mediterranea MF3/22]
MIAAAENLSFITYFVKAIMGLILKAAKFLGRLFGLKSKVELNTSSTRPSTPSKTSYVLLDGDPEKETSLVIRKGAGTNEREFATWMKKNVPHIKWRIVYEDTEEPKKMKLYVWESCLEPFIDFFFGEALEKMKALTQPKEAPLTYEVVELVVFAKKEGYEVECFAYTHKLPYDFQYTIKGPDGYKFESEATFWEPGCWRDAAEQLGRETEDLRGLKRKHRTNQREYSKDLNFVQNEIL